MIQAIYEQLNVTLDLTTTTSQTHLLLQQLKERLSANPVERRAVHTWNDLFDLELEEPLCTSLPLPNY